MVFTTLFDSYYLDKGIVLYRSLEQLCDDFKLYIFCFDEKSYEILSDMKLKHAVILRNTVLEDEVLLKKKEERTKAEYCWTCTPITIEYVLEHYNEDSCTYIDADMYFFANPKVLFEEIEEKGANIVITPHRFGHNLNDKYHLKRSGKYCVEFNYFDQSDNARKALSWWKERCLEWCFHLYETDRMGDQKYLEKFPNLFEGVHELQNLGGGVAPWNLGQYVLEESSKNENEAGQIFLKERLTGVTFPIVFYHFQNIRFLSSERVNVCSGTHSKKTKDAIYPKYLSLIKEVRAELKSKYGIVFDVKKVYSSNPIIGFLQGTVLRFKVKSVSDIYDLNKL